MSQQDQLTAQKRFGQAVNTGQLEALRHLIAAEVKEHDPAPGQGSGPEGYIEMFRAMRAAFPDLAITVETVVADEDKVAMAYTMTGTQQGPFLGVPASGRSVRARGMQIARFENGKLVERWGSSDQLGILQQIGATERVQAPPRAA